MMIGRWTAADRGVPGMSWGSMLFRVALRAEVSAVLGRGGRAAGPGPGPGARCSRARSPAGHSRTAARARRWEEPRA